MSQQVAAINLSAAVIGTTGAISWQSAAVPPTIRQQMLPQQTGAALLVWNDSGCILRCVYPTTLESFTLTAGAWRELHPPAGEIVINYTVTAIFPNATVSFLLADYFAPGEPVDAVGTLGNSPIGLSGSLPTSVTQVINDVNPAVGVVLEAKPTTGPNAGISSAGINNDGSFYFGGNHLTGDNAGKLTAAELTSADAITAVRALIGSGAQFQVNSSGVITFIGNQATAGSYGAAPVVAQALGVHVTATTLQTILTYTPGANGFFRINAYLNAQNATTPQAINFNVSYTDPDSNISTFVDLATTAAGSLQVFNGVTNIATGGGNAPYSIITLVIHAKASTAITVKYTDPGGTPNDFVTAIIELLA